MLTTYIHERKKRRELLLMTHIVVGYPSLQGSLELVSTMVEAGVDLIELQIPFSEPIADGPVIACANQVALQGGLTVDQAFELAATLSARHPIPFLFMTYANILMQRGIPQFTSQMKQAGLHGAIVPDLPPEEAGAYLDAMRDNDLDPIFIFSPTTTPQRLQRIADCAKGFVYCVARKGVTGQATDFSGELQAYLARCRQATNLPLAVGFGVRSRRDLDALRGHADIAVVGSETLRVLERDGLPGVKALVEELVG